MPPPKPRERFNAKARQSQAGSSHKKRKQAPRRSDAVGEDDLVADVDADEVHDASNALLIDPVKEKQRQGADRRRRALLAQQDPHAAEAPISSKKRKRLDAYIARQLKKEKRQQLIADLAKSSTEIADRSALVTAATLGTGRAQTGQDRLDQDTAKTDRQAQKRGNPYAVVGADDESSSDLEGNHSQDEGDGSVLPPIDKHIAEEADDDRDARIARARALFGNADSGGSVAERNIPQTQSRNPENAGQELGSALALGPDGKPLMPTLRKRRKQARKPGGKKTAWGRVADANEMSSEPDSGFDSSASSDDDGDEARHDTFQHGRYSRTNALSDAKPKGMPQVGESDEDLGRDSAFDESSDSSYTGSDDEGGSGLSDGESGTDEDEWAILEEAMRRRGMLGDPSIPPPNENDYARSDEEQCQRITSKNEKSSLPFTDFGGVSDSASEGDRTNEDGSAVDQGVSRGIFGENGEDGEEGIDEGELDGEEEEDDAILRSSSDEDSEQAPRRRGIQKTQRSSGFKDWAQSALGLTQTGSTSASRAEEDEYKGPEPVAGLSHKVGDNWDGVVRGPLGEDQVNVRSLSPFARQHYDELETLRGTETKAQRYHVSRDDAVQEARLKLPVVADEDQIVRTISENMVTVLCGETGSGKTTQVPQFLFEAGFGSAGSQNPGMIGITQPRRVAALSMAARVGHELGLGPNRVSHQIRYDANVSPFTSIKFMTDGVLLREIALDFLLEKYSAVIIDEAHERSVNTDVLIGVLSRIVQFRAKRWLEGAGRPLRLVIMSATLRVDDFAKNVRLFKHSVPVLQIEARQYPVVTHFSRKTHHDYIEETVKKTCKIHARLPHGGILIFLTGQAEISTVCKRLEKKYGERATQRRIAARERAQQRAGRRSSLGDSDDDEAFSRHTISLAAKDGDVEAEEIDLGADIRQEDLDLALDADDRNAFDDEEALETDDEDVPEYDANLPEQLRDDTDRPMHILPLYSLLPSDKQMEVFQSPPEGARLVVVATNIAETSLTIPGITYVVDCGRSKERKYDAINGVQSFEVGFISKASANQRAGRAGRTGPGHCYRLYSSNLYEQHMPTFAEPEILRTPVDNLVLMMKNMNIDNVANFPFPTPPEREALYRAEKLLVRLGALEKSEPKAGKSVPSASENKITQLGRAMSLFPLGTRLSKLLVQGNQHGCLPLVIALVAALSVGDPFVQENALQDDTADVDAEMRHGSEDKEDDDSRRARRSAYLKSLNRFAAMGGALGDPLRLLNVVGAYEHEGGSVAFCEKNFLISKVMEEIHKLRGQITSLVRANAAPGTDVSSLSSPRLDPPTSQQVIVLRQFLLAAYIDQVAIRADLAPESAAHVAMLQGGNQGDTTDGAVSRQFHQQKRIGAKMQSTQNVAYLASGIPNEACFVHKTSVLFHQRPPEWLVFTQVLRGRAKGDRLERKGRNWLKGVVTISPKWIYPLGPTLCSLSKPVEIDSSNSRSRLAEAAQELKRRQALSEQSSSSLERSVYLVPSYGTGPAMDASERSSHVGWSLPPILAKQRLINGRWVTQST